MGRVCSLGIVRTTPGEEIIERDAIRRKPHAGGPPTRRNCCYAESRFPGCPAMLTLLIAAALALGLPGDRAAGAKPNLLFILMDDVGTERIAAYGEHPLPAVTPAIDGLARQGVLFRNAYAAPVCGPARATVLTGRFGTHTGIGWNIPFDVDGTVIGSGGPFGLPTNETPLPRLLQQHGYRTAVIGKWHLANTHTGGNMHPVLVGFELHAGPLVQGSYFDWNKNVASPAGFEVVIEPDYSPSAIVDDALTWVDAVGDAQPWFLWLAFLSAHTPLHVPPEALLSPDTQAALDAGPPSDALLQRAMVEAMDTEIGRLLESLDPQVRENTLIVLMADNGSEGDFMEAPLLSGGHKGTLFEGGVRVPLIVSGAGVAQPGREVQQLACSVDLYATLLDLAGVPLPSAPPIDGLSLRTLLEDPRAPATRRSAYAEKFQPNGFGPKSVHKRVLRDERYKLWQTLAPTVANPLRLFDLAADPLESVNLLGAGMPALDAGQQAAFDALWAQLSSLDD